MKSFFLFLKGVCVGIGKIIPGVSGSVIALVLHVYEEALMAINHFWKNPKKYGTFLLVFGSGILFSVLLLSQVISYFYHYHFGITMYFFLGLILGTIPSFQKSVSLKNVRNLIVFLISFSIPILISTFSFKTFEPSNSWMSLFFIFLLGIIEASTMIIPGVSGTAIYIMLGSYTFILSLFGNPLNNILWTFLFGFGLVVGIVLVSRLLEICLNRFPKFFYSFIDGFLWSSIFYLLSLISNIFSVSNLILLIIGFIITFFMTNKNEF